ncbi:GSCFA domain-containing protein [Piscinibacter sakaiensis]|uniref:GSCFA domain-containing protein n=1 Tax=Piscinibacter sakaiensis TaxID=1547922 RepID=UPI00372AF8E2
MPRRWPSAPRPSAPRHPYEALPDERYWRRAVAGLDPSQVDPVGPGFPLRIAPGERVASAGSCFAQHLSRALEAAGMGYLVTEEAPPGLSPAEAAARHYRIYSARYGNVYTARQLRQLFERAFGRFTPLEEAWARDDGRWVDPFRPQIEPEGFESLEALRAARDEHLAAVRRMFEQLDVLVFTLGLTEAWADRRDGAVFPLAPGVAGGRHDPARHVFRNARVAEVVDDLRSLLRGLRELNPRARLLLTVSPVPLVATAEPRHVLVSTAASKAVLRAAAQEIADDEPGCAYFPSYELVTGPQQRGAAFEADLRSVRPAVVAAAPGEALQAELRELGRIICDEEALDAASAR